MGSGTGAPFVCLFVYAPFQSTQFQCPRLQVYGHEAAFYVPASLIPPVLTLAAFVAAWTLRHGKLHRWHLLRWIFWLPDDVKIDYESRKVYYRPAARPEASHQPQEIFEAVAQRCVRINDWLNLGWSIFMSGSVGGSICFFYINKIFFLDSLYISHDIGTAVIYTWLFAVVFATFFTLLSTRIGVRFLQCLVGCIVINMGISAYGGQCHIQSPFKSLECLTAQCIGLVGTLQSMGWIVMATHSFRFCGGQPTSLFLA